MQDLTLIPPLPQVVEAELELELVQSESSFPVLFLTGIVAK